MTKIITSLFFFLAIPLFSFSQYTLTVIIEGLDAGGIVLAGLYNGPNDFLDEPGMIKQYISDTTEEILTYQWENLPAGNYSIAFLEDQDGDGVMDFNFFGVPKERYGFYPNQGFRLRKPTWEECNFPLSVDMTVVLAAK